MFEEAFPHYLLYGMTPEQYWEQDPYLVIAYRKLARLRAEQRNQEMWVQGMYVLDAISVIVSGFRKGAQPHKYPQEPYDITGRKKEEAEREPTEQEKAEARQKIIDKLNAFKKAWENRENGNA